MIKRLVCWIRGRARKPSTEEIAYWHNLSVVVEDALIEESVRRIRPSATQEEIGLVVEKIKAAGYDYSKFRSPTKPENSEPTVHVVHVPQTGEVGGIYRGPLPKLSEPKLIHPGIPGKRLQVDGFGKVSVKPESEEG